MAVGDRPWDLIIEIDESGEFRSGDALPADHVVADGRLSKLGPPDSEDLVVTGWWYFAWSPPEEVPVARQLERLWPADMVLGADTSASVLGDWSRFHGNELVKRHSLSRQQVLAEVLPRIRGLYLEAGRRGCPPAYPQVVTFRRHKGDVVRQEDLYFSLVTRLVLDTVSVAFETAARHPERFSEQQRSAFGELADVAGDAVVVDVRLARRFSFNQAPLKAALERKFRGGLRERARLHGIRRVNFEVSTPPASSLIGCVLADLFCYSAYTELRRWKSSYYKRSRKEGAERLARALGVPVEAVHVVGPGQLYALGDADYQRLVWDRYSMGGETSDVGAGAGLRAAEGELTRLRERLAAVERERAALVGAKVRAEEAEARLAEADSLVRDMAETLQLLEASQVVEPLDVMDEVSRLKGELNRQRILRSDAERALQEERDAVARREAAERASTEALADAEERVARLRRTVTELEVADPGAAEPLWREVEEVTRGLLDAARGPTDAADSDPPAGDGEGGPVGLGGEQVPPTRSKESSPRRGRRPWRWATVVGLLGCLGVSVLGLGGVGLLVLGGKTLGGSSLDGPSPSLVVDRTEFLRPKVVDASSYESCSSQLCRPEHLVDGDLSTVWCSHVSRAGPGKSVTLHFGREVALAGLDAQTYVRATDGSMAEADLRFRLSSGDEVRSNADVERHAGAVEPGTFAAFLTEGAVVEVVHETADAICVAELRVVVGVPS